MTNADMREVQFVIHRISPQYAPAHRFDVQCLGCGVREADINQLDLLRFIRVHTQPLRDHRIDEGILG